MLSSPGQPLKPHVRADAESRFGLDLDDMRVHDDPAAASSAGAINAHAYTFGSHIVFGVGHYAPTTPSGAALLRHEIAHSIQQRRSSTQAPRHAVETEATRAEHASVGPIAVGVASAPSLALAEAHEKGWWDQQVEMAVAWLSTQHHELQQAVIGSVRRSINHWPPDQFAIADQVLNVIELIDDISFGIVMFIAGANLGVVEGVVDLVVGFLVALEKVMEYMLSWLLQPLDDSRHFREMNERLLAAISGLPSALRSSFRAWQDELRAAPPDKKAFMLGRAFGQLVVLLLGAIEGAGLVGGAAAAVGEASGLARAFAFVGVQGAEAATMGVSALGPAGAAVGALGAPAMQMTGKETVESAGKGRPRKAPPKGKPKAVEPDLSKPPKGEEVFEELGNELKTETPSNRPGQLTPKRQQSLIDEARAAETTVVEGKYVERFKTAHPEFPGGKEWQVHHSIPQRFRAILRKAGINVDSVEFLRGARTTPGEFSNVHSKITTYWQDWARTRSKKRISDYRTPRKSSNRPSSWTTSSGTCTGKSRRKRASRSRRRQRPDGESPAIGPITIRLL